MIAAPEIFTTVAPEFIQIGGRKRKSTKSTRKTGGKKRGKGKKSKRRRAKKTR